MKKVRGKSNLYLGLLIVKRLFHVIYYFAHRVNFSGVTIMP